MEYEMKMLIEFGTGFQTNTLECIELIFYFALEIVDLVLYKTLLL